jgi:hypothetical protein
MRRRVVQGRLFYIFCMNVVIAQSAIYMTTVYGFVLSQQSAVRQRNTYLARLRRGKVDIASST